VGIVTGFIEMADTTGIYVYEYDMFMQIKVLASFIFMAFYSAPLIYRLYFRRRMWISKGMSITYICMILGGFFYLWVTTFVGAHYTALQHGNTESIELVKIILSFLSFIGVFIMFGAQGNIVTEYSGGQVITMGIVPLLSTLLVIVAIAVISYILFREFRQRQIRNYKQKYENIISLLNNEKKSVSMNKEEYDQILKEIIELKIKVK